MKHLTRIFVWLTAVILIAACGGETAVTDPTPIAPLPTQTAAPPTPLPTPVISDSGGSTNTDNQATNEQQPETAPEPTAAPQKVRPWPVSDFGYGTQVHGNATVGDPAQIMRSVRNDLGLDWVKAQIRWDNIHPSPDAGQWFFYDGVIDEAQRNNLHLMLSVVTAPEWTRAAGGIHGPPDDYNEYANFLTEMINRHPGKIDAIEVWNEQNLDREWVSADGINPEKYVEFLTVAYNAIKAADPNIIVISGALSPAGPSQPPAFLNDFEYMDRALAAGMLDVADCIGAHHNGYNVPPDVLVQDTGSLPEAGTATYRGPFDNQFSGNTPNTLWTFKSTIDGYIERIQAYPNPKPLCVTEFGWASSEGYDQVPQGFEYARDNTLEEQAQWIVQAFQQMQANEAIWLAFQFNYDFGNKGSGVTDDPVPYSILDINGAPRPAFGAVADMEKPK